MGKENRPVFARGWGERANCERVHGNLGRGMTELFNILVVVTVITFSILKHRNVDLQT